jgi:isopenicillin N synthase-like dioxygenase
LKNPSTIIDACKKFGFFYIPCDETDISLLSELTGFAIDYFNQPIEIKNELKADINGIGYIGDGRIVLDKKRASRYEIFTYRGNELKHPNVPLFNKYMSKIDEYGKAILMALMHSIFPSSDQTREYLSTIYPNYSSLMMAHYINIQSDEKEGIFGLSEHTDWGLITILYTTKEGLEIFHDNRWVRVPAIKNHFIINTGDVVEILSGGIYRSVLHRVTIDYDRFGMDKYSIVHFYDPNKDFVVVPYDSGMSKYKPIKYGDFMTAKYTNTIT